MTTIQNALGSLNPLGKGNNPYWTWLRSSPLVGIFAEGVAIIPFQKELRLKSLREENVAWFKNGAFRVTGRDGSPSRPRTPRRGVPTGMCNPFLNQTENVNGGRGFAVTMVHPKTGLELEVGYQAYPDTQVLEWEGRVHNRSRRTIRNVRPFSLYLDADVCGTGLPRQTTVYGGASTEGRYPPPSYRVEESEGSIAVLSGREGGRSTETHIPTLIVADAESGQGFFLAYEWPCRSIIQFGPGPDIQGKRRTTLWAHPGWVGLDLKPGESVALPRVDLGFFKGDGVAGSNALRRHIVRHVIRPVRDGSPLPPVFYNHYYGFTNEWDAKVLRREADAYAELGAEYFVVDAGWFKGGFRNGIGNWDLVDPKHFPRGMEEFGRYVESKGMKFGSWLEIEFAMQDSDWAKRHPGWYRSAKGMQNTMYGLKRFNDVLLRLEDRKVRAQVADWMEGWVRRYRIQWLRWDFNNTPLPFWTANEKINEMGRLHMGYGEGLLALLDEFMARCPQVHIEACAGGGHRMDLGTLRRAHSAWMNDNSSTHHAIRRFQAGLNRAMPGNYGNSCFLWATHGKQRERSLAWLRQHGYPSQIIRSRMGGSLAFAEQTWFWTPRDRAYLKSEVEKYKSVRHLIMKDFYPLFSPASLREYDGWQFHDPETGEGYCMVFRCEAPGRQTEVTLGGMARGERVEVVDLDSGRREKPRGGRALPVTIAEKNGTRWFRYRVV